MRLAVAEITMNTRHSKETAKKMQPYKTRTHHITAHNTSKTQTDSTRQPYCTSPQTLHRWQSIPAAPVIWFGYSRPAIDASACNFISSKEIKERTWILRQPKKKNLMAITARTNIWIEGQEASDGSQGSKTVQPPEKVICEKRALGKKAPPKTTGP